MQKGKSLDGRIAARRRDTPVRSICLLAQDEADRREVDIFVFATGQRSGLISINSILLPGWNVEQDISAQGRRCATRGDEIEDMWRG